MNKVFFKRFFWPSIFLLVFGSPIFFWEKILSELGIEVINKTILFSQYSIIVFLWVTITLIFSRFVDEVLFNIIVSKNLQKPVPKILKDVISLIIFVIAISAMLTVVFKFSLAGVFAASGMIGLVVGLALKNIISDIFSGIILNMERPFDIGEWIAVGEDHRSDKAVIGCVLQINWRATYLKTADGVTKIYPNTTMRTVPITNLERPSKPSRFRETITLDFSVDMNRALRIMQTGLNSAKGVLKDPKAKVKVLSTSTDGIVYDLRFWIEPEKCSPSSSRHNVYLNVIKHLDKAGISISYSKQDVFISKMPKRLMEYEKDCEKLLKKIEIFKCLNEDEINSLSKKVIQNYVRKDEIIISKGDESDHSLFFLLEGLLNVYPNGDCNSKLVSQLRPGDIFGEMSLLTGEPRSATVKVSSDAVIFKIEKEDIEPIITLRPEIANDISQIIAQRIEINSTVSSDEKPKTDHPKSFFKNLANQIKSFFGLIK